MPRCSLRKARNRASSVGLMTRYSPVRAGISHAEREKKRAARGGPRLVRRRLELALGLRRGDLLVERALAAEDVELAVDDLPGVGVAAGRDGVHDAIAAIGAELRDVLLGRRVEE